MSQNFQDNFYSSTGVVDTNMSEANVNFAAVKSSFSGVEAPDTPIDGLLWYDTQTKILKIYYDGGWLNFFNSGENEPIIEGLKTAAEERKITLAMINSALKSPAGGDEGLRKLGTTSTSACAGNDSRIIGPVVVGDKVIGRSDHEVVVEMPPASYLRLKEFDVLREGAYRISWEYKTYHDYRLAKTYLYQNETLLYTYQTSSTSWVSVSVDRSGWVCGDKISIRGNATYGLGGENKIYIRNARVSVDVSDLGMPSYSHY